MTLGAAVQLGLLASIWLIVLSLGARASVESLLFLVRRPSLLARALIAMFVVVPAFAVLLAATTGVPAPIRFAIVALSAAPAPPVLPYKQIKAGAGADYALSLLATAAVVSILLTPLLIAAAARILGAQASVSIGATLRPLLISIGLPLLAGVLLRAVSARAAQSVSDVGRRAGSLLLLAMFVLMLAAAAPEILRLLRDGAVLVIAATIVAGLLSGHLLGGREHAAALGLAAATRHPGVALAIAEASYPDQREEITGAILLSLLITLLVTAPYVRWARGRQTRVEAVSAKRA